MPLLEIENLSVEFPTAGGVMRAVDGVSLSVDEGEFLGIVGESGSGKSVTMLAVMGLVGFPGQVTADRLAFAGRGSSPHVPLCCNTARREIPLTAAKMDQVGRVSQKSPW